MKRWLTALVMTGLALALLSSGSAKAGGELISPKKVSYGGISFTYEEYLAGEVRAESVGEVADRSSRAWWEVYPAHTKFEFVDFRGSSATSAQPAIYVFPVRSSYQYLNPGEPDIWQWDVETLKALLSSKPDLRAEIEKGIREKTGSPPTFLPYLPPVNAAMSVVGKPAYVSFINGMGIRYLVEGAQDVSPPDRDNTLYTFQGLTDDGKYYVAARFPAFPLAMAPISVFAGDNDDFKAYWLGLLDIFGKIDNAAFTPDLNKLDAMMKSLTVTPDRGGQGPQMPQTGNASSVEAGWVLGGLLAVATVSAVGGVLLRRREG